MKKTKICTKCGKRKQITEFYLDNSKKDGRKSYCKDCAREMEANRRETLPSKSQETAERLITDMVYTVAEHLGFSVDYYVVNLRKKN